MSAKQNEGVKNVMSLKIRLLDKVLEGNCLDTNKIYEVIRTETNREDDLYYIVINEEGKEVAVHELLAEEVIETVK